MLRKFKKMLKLSRFNRRNGTDLRSYEVSLRATFGVGVRVGRRSVVDRNCKVGQHTYVGNNCNITKAEIGNYSSIGNNVSIGQGEHYADRISTSTIFYEAPYQELTRESCVVGNDVWVGSDALILRGVRVGNGAIVGANAVVTKDVKDFEVVVGVPARHLKYRFKPDLIAQINQSSWWSQGPREARQIIEKLEEVIANGEI